MIGVSCTTVAEDTLWAKSAPPPGTGSGYPLLQHLLDVAAVARELLEAVPCPIPLPCSRSWISALVGFHDLGKASPGFQRKLANPAASSAGAAGAPDRHDASTVPLLTLQLTRRGLDQSTAWSLANAVGAHHGNLINPVELQAACRWRFAPEWLIAHDQLFAGVITGTSAEELPALPTDPSTRSAYLQWLMGLTTVADWIGSSEAICDWDRLDTWTGNAVSWYASSRTLARQTLADLGMAGAGLQAVASGPDAIAVALDGRLPRPLQQAMANVIDLLGDAPGLVVIEAPMGEGKTEAGFALARGRGLYVAMPTQATCNALFERVAGFLSRATVGPTQLALAHGAGGPAAAYNRLRDVGLGTADSGVTAGWWFRGSKRALLASNGIGTVDQALIGVLNSRHGFVRLFGLAGRTVILDEVHAYDTYTGGLIERLVIWLQQLGCRVVLMSATLPAARRDSILQAWAGDVGVAAVAYPRVTWALPGSVQSLPFPASRQQQLRVRAIGADDVATQAVAMAQQGARVLVVVNKVARAQALLAEITSAVPTTLFHARFPMDRRLEIGSSVLKQFGPDGTCTTGHVLVATQVAEQSLDIDMDVLITDIAPVDLVLQRAGRIHRHDRLRPPRFTDPLVLVAGLDQAIPPESLTSYVYDRWLVLRSYAWLQDHPVLHLPDDIDRGVQEVYGANWSVAPGALAEAITAAWSEHQGEELQLALLAQQAALQQPLNWGMHSNVPPVDDDAAESGAIRFGTRLGQDSLSVIPVTQEHLDNLPAHADVLAGHYLRISHRQVMAAVRATPLPTGWRDHPGLRHHLPLLVDDSGAGPGWQLDPMLGLVIRASGGAIP